MGFTGTDYVVVRRILLEHEPHGADIVGSIAPIAPGFEVAEVELVLDTVLDLGDGAGNLAGDEGLAAARGLVVEENAAVGVEAVALAVIDGEGMGEELGAGIGRSEEHTPE